MKNEILKELRIIAEKNRGTLPRGTIALIARKYKLNYQQIHWLAKDAQVVKSHSQPYLKKDKESEKEKDQDIQGEPSELKYYIARLEGAINGIKPFHPRLAAYMEGELNTIYRVLHKLGYIMKDKRDVFSDLSYKSKPGYEEADAEINKEEAEERKKRKQTIIDNAITNDLED